MNETNRQIAIIYALLLNKGHLSYADFCSKFLVTEKTLRQDIKTINDSFKQNNIEVKLKKSKGFYLECDDETRDKLKKQFTYRYYNVNDLLENYHSRSIKILSMLFTNKGYIKIEEISQKLNLNTRSVSAILKNVRASLQGRGLRLESKPYYGLRIMGNEILIRFFFSDFSCFYNLDDFNSLFEDDIEAFGIPNAEKIDISKLCIKLVRKFDIKISQIELRKLIVMILFTHQRASRNHAVEFTEDQIELIKDFDKGRTIDCLMFELKKYYNYNFSENEEWFLTVFFMINLDYTFEECQNLCNVDIKNEARGHLNKIIDRFVEIGVCTRLNYKVYSDSLFPVVLSATIRKRFNIIEGNPNSEIKKIVSNSPLTATIGLKAFKILENSLQTNLGEYICFNLGISIHSCIRAVQNVKKLNVIAVFTPFDKSSGESLKRRILDRFSNIIKRIDVITSYDVLTKDISIYNQLIYFEKMEPLGISSEIKKLEVDYFFTARDVDNFYEFVSIPSRKYKSSFANIRLHDYILEYKYVDFETLKVFILSQQADSAWLEPQINELELSSKIIFNETLNIILFTDRESRRMTRLLLLKNSFLYLNNKISRIFIHVVELNGNQIKVKTTEKVVRNLTCQSDTKESILVENPIDFYQYYICNIEKKLV